MATDTAVTINIESANQVDVLFLRFNKRGNKFAMLTREQGMGRNISELVSWVSNRCCDAAGDYHHSYWPQPVFLVMNPRTNKAGSETNDLHMTFNENMT